MPKLSKADAAAKVSTNEARRRKEVAIAGRRELELRQMKRDLLPAAEVKAAWLGMVTRFKSALQALPSTAAPDLADVDARRAKAVLDNHVDRILRQLAADFAPKEADASGNS